MAAAPSSTNGITSPSAISQIAIPSSTTSVPESKDGRARATNVCSPNGTRRHTKTRPISSARITCRPRWAKSVSGIGSAVVLRTTCCWASSNQKDSSFNVGENGAPCIHRSASRSSMMASFVKRAEIKEAWCSRAIRAAFAVSARIRVRL
ncbi:hypothetical protein SE16_01150 [Ardenticatena maritima]|uniref:Uncharacterized protein n=1 Tax=Ardenticatena maritima TaxID=872965 RepID=A0A0P6YVN3_9CHLR|nr:hypothetical protein SE16_01150 [Ardenticatena maritima]